MGPVRMKLRNMKFRCGTGRRRFAENQVKDIQAGRGFVCQEIACRAWNNDKKKSKEYAIVDGIQFDGASDHALEKSDKDSKNWRTSENKS